MKNMKSITILSLFAIVLLFGMALAEDSVLNGNETIIYESSYDNIEITNSSPENCFDGIDNDGDVLPDCYDPSCSLMCGDRVGDSCDNCPAEYNTDQADADTDGHGTSSDCQDNDAAVYPGAQEICDGKDNDCDSQIDEGGDSLCSDNLPCNGVETCEGVSGCVYGIPIECSPFNLEKIETCSYDSEGNDMTFDYFSGFISTCDENTGTCRIGIVDIKSSCSASKCNAECEKSGDCANKCVGDTNYFSGLCTDGCSCSYSVIRDCNKRDGWYYKASIQWVNTDYCNKKQQAEQEYRDYICSEDGCSLYVVNETRWVDTGETMYEIQGTTCDDGQFCTVNDDCNGIGSCFGFVNTCNDSISCTEDSCNEISDICENVADNLKCDDGLYCNGNEICDTQSGCKSGTEIDCSANDINGIVTCGNSPDGNPYTWDFRNPLVSTCVDTEANTGYCTNGDNTITHVCSNSKCGAECDSISLWNDYCYGDEARRSGTCSSDSCSWTFETEDCSKYENWYDVSPMEYKEVSIPGEICNKMKQKKQEYRDYTCSATDGVKCSYVITGYQWVDVQVVDYDEDNDMVCNDVDKCSSAVPVTGFWTAQSLKPNHFDGTNTNMTQTYGCNCAQILFCKPGEDTGEFKSGCTKGTMNIWTSQKPESWAVDCQVEGKVMKSGDGKFILVDTDGDFWLDLLDTDKDNDGIPDSEDDMTEDADLPEESGYGTPDWYVKKN